LHALISLPHVSSLHCVPRVLGQPWIEEGVNIASSTTYLISNPREGPYPLLHTMKRQFANISYSPWRDPYGSAIPGMSPYMVSAPTPQSTYTRIVLPPAPVFFHPGVEQVIEPSDDDDEDDDAGAYARSLR